MFEVTVEADFSASHILEGYNGPCANLHGHNYRVQATAEGDKLDELGMVLDLSILKQALREVVGSLDHCHLNDHPDFAGIIPSSEHVARYVFDKVRTALAGVKPVDQVWLREVRVIESDKSWVIYRP